MCQQRKEQICRFGVWADWDSPYLTLDPAYEAAQLRVFAKMVDLGHIYRGRKPVHWSPSSQTALAEAVRLFIRCSILLQHDVAWECKLKMNHIIQYPSLPLIMFHLPKP